MSAPSLRTVVVAAGFLGVSMIVAGAATAMTADAPDEPIANAVTVENPAANVAPAVPAQPVEVGLAPIECADDGSCGPRPEHTSADESAEQTSAAAPQDDPATTVANVAAAEADAACTLPERPAKPSDDDWSAWKERLHDWVDEVKAAAHDCDLDRSEWRALLGESAWKDVEERRGGGDWSRSDDAERPSSDDERGSWAKDRDGSRERWGERTRDGRGDGDRDRWGERSRGGWGDDDRDHDAESGDRRR